MRKIIIILFLTFIACQEESLYDIQPSEIRSNYLRFDSFEEFHSTLEHLSKLNIQELKAFEDNNGFTSFYSKCENIYVKLRDNEYFSKEEMIQEINKYDKYVELLEIEGEIELETKLSSSLLKFLLNKDRIIEIEGDIYKVFDNSIAKGGTESLQELIELEEAGQIINGNYPKIELVNANHSSFRKDAQYIIPYYNMGFYSAEQNKRRVKMQIHIYQVTPNNLTDIYCDHIIRPQKKILGVWYRYTAEIDAQIRLRYDYTSDGTNWDDSGIAYLIDQETNNFTNYDHVVLLDDVVPDSYFHIGGMDCWATTDDITNYATATQNASICPPIE